MKETDQLKKLMESMDPISEGSDPVGDMQRKAEEVASYIREVARESDSSSNRALFGDMVEELGKDFVEMLELELNMRLNK